MFLFDKVILFLILISSVSISSDSISFDMFLNIFRYFHTDRNFVLIFVPEQPPWQTYSKERLSINLHFT